MTVDKLIHALKTACDTTDADARETNSHRIVDVADNKDVLMIVVAIHLSSKRLHVMRNLVFKAISTILPTTEAEMKTLRQDSRILVGLIMSVPWSLVHTNLAMLQGHVRHGRTRMKPRRITAQSLIEGCHDSTAAVTDNKALVPNGQPMLINY